MLNRIEAGICCALFLAGVAWAAAPRPLVKVSLLSIPGTLQRCGLRATSCPIPVRVAASDAVSGCVATVDIETVYVKSVRGGAASQTPVTWYLAKTDMSDGNVYEFAGDGIYWPQAASAALDFASQPSGLGNVSRWVPRFQAASRPALDYVPLVRIKGKTPMCDASDPRIVNDGQ